MSMTVEKKKCIDCGASEIYADGIYCNSCKRFVGRSNEQTCILTDSVKNEMSMTESEAIEKLRSFKSPRNVFDGFGCQAIELAITALEEVQQYRAIGTVSEFRENKNFLEFLHNTILPNEMEKYLAMYHASEEKSVDWSEGKE